MKIKLLKNGYKNSESFYQDFLNDSLLTNEEYFMEETITVGQLPDFKVYLHYRNEAEKENYFLESIQAIATHYLPLGREVYLNETFWHSYLVTEKRDYLLREYPQIRHSFSQFKNIVIKPFDWESYVYKCVLGAEYVTNNIESPDDRLRYYHLIIDNLDLYNYIIKSEVYRNDLFLLKILDIIDELQISYVLKAKIKNRPDLGPDERYGRRVIYEMNKSYPVLMVPLLDKADLKELFLTYLSYYYDLSGLELKLI